jgi:hypothetical protein
MAQRHLGEQRTAHVGGASAPAAPSFASDAETAKPPSESPATENPIRSASSNWEPAIARASDNSWDNDSRRAIQKTLADLMPRDERDELVRQMAATQQPVLAYPMHNDAPTTQPPSQLGQASSNDPVVSTQPRANSSPRPLGDAIATPTASALHPRAPSNRRAELVHPSTGARSRTTGASAQTNPQPTEMPTRQSARRSPRTEEFTPSSRAEVTTGKFSQFARWFQRSRKTPEFAALTGGLTPMALMDEITEIILPYVTRVKISDRPITNANGLTQYSYDANRDAIRARRVEIAKRFDLTLSNAPFDPRFISALASEVENSPEMAGQCGEMAVFSAVKISSAAARQGLNVYTVQLPDTNHTLTIVSSIRYESRQPIDWKREFKARTLVVDLWQGALAPRHRPALISAASENRYTRLRPRAIVQCRVVEAQPTMETAIPDSPKQAASGTSAHASALAVSIQQPTHETTANPPSASVSTQINANPGRQGGSPNETSVSASEQSHPFANQIDPEVLTGLDAASPKNQPTLSQVRGNLPFPATLDEFKNAWTSWAREFAPGERRQDAYTALEQDMRWGLTIDDNTFLLDLSGHRLSSLPDIWPGHMVRMLVLCENNLTGATLNLPPSATHINLSYNRELGSIPSTSSSVIELNVTQCGLTSLEGLSEGIEKLSAHRNNLSVWPTHLPNSLKKIKARSNNFTSLPSQPPSNLIKLDLKNNRITSLPEDIVEWSPQLTINLEGNPLPERVINNLQSIMEAPGYHGPRIHFSMASGVNFPTRPLADALKSWYAEVGQAVPQVWNKYLEEEGAPEFSRFLDRLCRGNVNYQDPAYRKRVLGLLNHLSEHPGQIPVCMGIAFGQSGNCDDRVSLTFNMMEQARLTYEIECRLYDDNPERVIDLIRQAFLREELERIADEKIPTLRLVDHTEVYLGFQERLARAFGIELGARNMRWYGVSGITDEDLKRAAVRLIEALGTRFEQYLASSEPWQGLLSRVYKEGLERSREKQMDLPRFEKELDEELERLTARANVDLESVAPEREVSLREQNENSARSPEALGDSERGAVALTGQALDDARRNLGAKVMKRIADEANVEVTREYLDSKKLTPLLPPILDAELLSRTVGNPGQIREQYIAYRVLNEGASGTQGSHAAPRNEFIANNFIHNEIGNTIQSICGDSYFETTFGRRVWTIRAALMDPSHHEYDANSVIRTQIEKMHADRDDKQRILPSAIVVQRVVDESTIQRIYPLEEPGEIMSAFMNETPVGSLVREMLDEQGLEPVEIARDAVDVYISVRPKSSMRVEAIDAHD